MTAPKRIRLSRRKGWRKPDNCVLVSRPSKWGNPFAVGQHICVGRGLNYRQTLITDAAMAVRAFENMLSCSNRNYPSHDEIRAELAGKHLACWCLLDQPCHADVFLIIANSPEAS